MADPRRLFLLLHDHNVFYVVIDRVAAALNGVPVLAVATALCPLDTATNNVNMAAALNAISPRTPEGRPIEVDAELLENGRYDTGIGIGLRFLTEYGPVDLVYTPDRLDAGTDADGRSLAYQSLIMEANIAPLRHE